MNNLEIFENPEFGSVRTIVISNEPWFVGKDVANILEYQNGSRDINRHVDSEDRQKAMVFDGNQDKETILINESGLYSLILSSKLPKAKQFKHWVTGEVLPTIRKHGGYLTQEKMEEALLNPDVLIKLATQLKSEREARKQAEALNEANRPKVIFAEAVSASKTSILVGELAKILRGNGVPIGQRRFFQWLRENGYLIKRKGTDYNMPTQRSMELGLFEIKEGSYVNGDGVNVITKTPKLTGKGQNYFINKFLKEA